MVDALLTANSGIITTSWIDSDILEQEHRKYATPHLRNDQVALIHRLHSDYRGRERHIDQFRHMLTQAKKHTKQTNQPTAYHHLQRASAKYRGA